MLTQRVRKLGLQLCWQKTGRAAKITFDGNPILTNRALLKVRASSFANDLLNSLGWYERVDELSC